MQVSFRDESGVARAMPGRGAGYWSASTPLVGDEVLLGAAVDEDHPGAQLVDRAPVNPPIKTYRVLSRKWLTPSHLLCRVEQVRRFTLKIGRTATITLRSDGNLLVERKAS